MCPIYFEDVQKNINANYHELIEKMIKDELLEKINEQIAVTPKGILLFYYLYGKQNN